MEYTTFKMQTSFGFLKGLAFYIANDVSIYEEIFQADKDTFFCKVDKIINEICAAAEISGNDFAEYELRWSKTDSGAVFCILNEVLPVLLMTKLFDMAFRFIESNPGIWTEFDEPGRHFRNNQLNYYLLKKLSDLYHIPECTGKVVRTRNGVYYLETDALLDDFLSIESLSEKEIREVVIKDVKRLYNSLKQCRNSV